jgi:transcriptional regulator with XRE-family HTH domain
MAYYPRIRDLREDNDKKQTELAKYLGTTAQYYGLYEKGVNEISFERAIMIAKYYNVSLDYLAGLTNNKKGLSVGDLTPAQQELLELLSSLTESEIKKFEKLTKLLSKINSTKGH